MQKRSALITGAVASYPKRMVAQSRIHRLSPCLSEWQAPVMTLSKLKTSTPSMANVATHWTRERKGISDFGFRISNLEILSFNLFFEGKTADMAKKRNPKSEIRNSKSLV